METLTEEERELIRVALDWFFVCGKASEPGDIAAWIVKETATRITGEQVKQYIRERNFRIRRL